MAKLGEAKVVKCPGCGKQLRLVFLGLYPVERGSAWRGICKRCGKTHTEAASEQKVLNGNP